jgi:hypothetical protein
MSTSMIKELRVQLAQQKEAKKKLHKKIAETKERIARLERQPVSADLAIEELRVVFPEYQWDVSTSKALDNTFSFIGTAPKHELHVNYTRLTWSIPGIAGKCSTAQELKSAYLQKLHKQQDHLEEKLDVISEH